MVHLLILNPTPALRSKHSAFRKKLIGFRSKSHHESQAMIVSSPFLIQSLKENSGGYI